MNLQNGQVVYVGNGKGADALDKFWKKVCKAKARIKAVATDLSAAFISSVMENAPDAALVFDHFHVVKLMNDTLDKLRRQAYNQEADLMKRKVLKGTRWLLLCNGEDIYDSYHKNRLENALEMNAPLMKGYYLKEALREIWMQVDKEQAEKVLCDWVRQAKDSKVPLLIKFANTLMAHRSGIIAWYDYHISTAKLERINNNLMFFLLLTVWKTGISIPWDFQVSGLVAVPRLCLIIIHQKPHCLQNEPAISFLQLKEQCSLTKILLSFVIDKTCKYSSFIDYKR